MDAGMEKECSALGGLFQSIMNDMKVKLFIFWGGGGQQNKQQQESPNTQRAI